MCMCTDWVREREEMWYVATPRGAMRMTYLPAGGRVHVALVAKVGHVLHHPVVDLRESQALLGRRLDRLRDQVRVALVAPSVPPRRLLPRAARRSGSSSRRRLRARGRGRGGERAGSGGGRRRGARASHRHRAAHAAARRACSANKKANTMYCAYIISYYVLCMSIGTE